MKELTFVVGVHHDTQEPTKEQTDDLHYDILHTIYEKVKRDHSTLKVQQIDVFFANEDQTISVLIKN